MYEKEIPVHSYSYIKTHSPSYTYKGLFLDNVASFSYQKVQQLGKNPSMIIVSLQSISCLESMGTRDS